MATLREQLAQPGSFVVATEIVTSRGLVTANRGGVLDLVSSDAPFHGTGRAVYQKLEKGPTAPWW